MWFKCRNAHPLFWRAHSWQYRVPRPHPVHHPPRVVKSACGCSATRHCASIDQQPQGADRRSILPGLGLACPAGIATTSRPPPSWIWLLLQSRNGVSSFEHAVRPGRIARCHGVGRDVMRHNRASPNDRSFTHTHTLKYRSSEPNPCTVANFDRCNCNSCPILLAAPPVVHVEPALLLVQQLCESWSTIVTPQDTITSSPIVMLVWQTRWLAPMKQRSPLERGRRACRNRHDSGATRQFRSRSGHRRRRLAAANLRRCPRPQRPTPTPGAQGPLQSSGRTSESSSASYLSVHPLSSLPAGAHPATLPGPLPSRAIRHSDAKSRALQPRTLPPSSDGHPEGCLIQARRRHAAVCLQTAGIRHGHWYRNHPFPNSQPGFGAESNSIHSPRIRTNTNAHPMNPPYRPSAAAAC